MVTVMLKGVHVIRARLAGGKVAEYHYAWRGGPRLSGAPGSAEYLSGYRDAHAQRKQPSKATLKALATMFRASPEYERLSDHSKRAYGRYLSAIEREFADLPIAALSDARVVDHFYRWRDGMAKTPRHADYAVSVLKRLLAWSMKRGKIRVNHAEGMDRLHRSDRSESVWSADDFKALRKVASKELWWAVQLAAFTGLRQGDLIALTWTHYDGESFQVRTSKTGRHVTIPATVACQALMKEIAKRQVTILTTARGKRPWTADGLRSSFRKACADAGVKRTFHDLRRTAATHLVASGLDASGVALIMGWSEDAVESLKRRYVSRSAVVASMLAKIEREA